MIFFMYNNYNMQIQYYYLSTIIYFEYLYKQVAVDIIQENLHLGAHGACQILIETAERLWKEMEGDYRDDVSHTTL